MTKHAARRRRVIRAGLASMDKSQEWLADRLHISRQQMTNVLRGDSDLMLGRARKISQLLRVPIEALSLEDEGR